MIHPFRRNRLKRAIEEVLAPAGIAIDGTRPHDVRVRDDRFYDAFVADGFTGIRDAYVEGWWETDRLDEATYRVLSTRVPIGFANRATLAANALAARLINLQSGRRANQIRAHYDLSDALFTGMLDRRKVYSCGYWRSASTLDEAQEAKLDLICRKLQLQPGMRVLDIGCGWGGLAQFAAERYGVSVVGLTVSRDQARLAGETCAGLPIVIRLADYRTLRGERFDAIASVGMFEHVGYKNYRQFFEIAATLLKPAGLFLLHTIGGNTSVKAYDPWMNRNIFHNGHLPSARQITEAAEGLLVLEDWHNFGSDYDRTLMAWYDNFERAWPSLRVHHSE
ncbi:MAG: cyclopropane-fatty-acyl-phospholipid synthase, partial [Thermoanaerobaculia bacterium]|nr:cyclopropane-fatty-acyl-phospholipid synthase [Thermoanaerobaculia bacterium]